MHLFDARYFNAERISLQNDHTDRSAGKSSSPVADCIFKLTTKVQDKILHDKNISRNDMENAGNAMRALTHQFISMSDKSGSLDHVDSKEFHNLKLRYLKVIKFITGTSFFTFHDADHLYTSEPLELTEFLRKLYDNNPELCVIDCTTEEYGSYGEVEEMGDSIQGKKSSLTTTDAARVRTAIDCLDGYISHDGKHGCQSDVNLALIDAQAGLLEVLGEPARYSCADSENALDEDEMGMGA